MPEVYFYSGLFGGSSQKPLHSHIKNPTNVRLSLSCGFASQYWKGSENEPRTLMQVRLWGSSDGGCEVLRAANLPEASSLITWGSFVCPVEILQQYLCNIIYLPWMWNAKHQVCHVEFTVVWNENIGTWVALCLTDSERIWWYLCSGALQACLSLGKLSGEEVPLESILPQSDLATGWGQWASLMINIHDKSLFHLPCPIWPLNIKKN